MIIARSMRAANPPSWRDALSDDDFTPVEPHEVAAIVDQVERVALTIAADLTALPDDVVRHLDELLMFALAARRGADVDRMDLSGGESAVLDAVAVRVHARLKRGAVQ